MAEERSVSCKAYTARSDLIAKRKVLYSRRDSYKGPTQRH